MSRNEGIVSLTWEPVMSTRMSARMPTMQVVMRRNQHCEPMMYQHRMWRTEGEVQASVKIGL
jgi:hypothetical protein